MEQELAPMLPQQTFFRPPSTKSILPRKTAERPALFPVPSTFFLKNFPSGFQYLKDLFLFQPISKVFPRKSPSLRIE